MYKHILCEITKQLYKLILFETKVLSLKIDFKIHFKPRIT